MSESSPWDKSEWAKTASGFVDRGLRRLRLWRLNQHDLDDIKQETLIHIWSKRHSYDSARPLNTWLATVVQNRIKNEMRNRFCYPGKTATQRTKEKRLLKLAFKYPDPIITRLVNPDDNDGERDELVYMPDLVDPATELKDIPDALEFRGTLNNAERQTFDSVLKDGKLPNSIKCKKEYLKQYRILVSIRTKWKGLINAGKTIVSS